MGHLVAVVAQADRHQESVWKAALASQGMAVSTVAPGEGLQAALAPAAARASRLDLVVVDLARLAVERSDLGRFASWLRERRPDARCVATVAARLAIGSGESRWAGEHGAAALVPRLSPVPGDRETASVLRRVLAPLGAAPDERQLATFMRVLASDTPRDTTPEALAARGIDLAALAGRMRSEVPCADRRYRLRTYADCFVGAEAAAWLRGLGLDAELAVAAGNALLERGVFHHVLREHAFEDGHLFYRFAPPPAPLDALDLKGVIERMRGAGGVGIRARSHHGTDYPACFVGAEAVDWFEASFGLDRELGIALGQRLIDLSLVHHVLDEHAFKDAHLFYRFYVDEPGGDGPGSGAGGAGAQRGRAAKPRSPGKAQ